MSENHDATVSRRNWVTGICAPTIALGLIGPESAALAPAPVDADKLSGARTYNVRDFGAAGDGKTLDTAAVQTAIDAAHRDQGGTVLVPAGDFVVGTLELKSNVTLHLAAKGRLLGSADITHYKAGNGIPPSNGNIVLISAAAAENVTIEGPGTIDGNGAKFYTGKGDGTGPGGNFAQGYSQRPHLLVFYRCKNLTIRDAFLTASAYHCCRILQCAYVKLDGVRIHNRVNKNNDGFHINSSHYVNIANCNVACQDDACALFGSNQFVTVTNCSFSTRWSVFRFGGGEARNITVSNCVIYETYGCPIKMRCGARSRFENISFANLVMDKVTGPISIGLSSAARRPAAAGDGQPVEKGVVRNISFNGIRANVVATGGQYDDLPFPNAFRPGETRTCIVLNGVGDEFLQDISFTDVHVNFEGGGTADEAAVRDVPQKAGEYFELGVLPAHALYARNVRGLTLHNVRFTTNKPDLRPAIVFDRVNDAAVTTLAAQGNPQAESVVRIINSRDVLLSAPRLLAPAAAFLQIEGQDNKAITVDGGDISRASRPLALTRGATENVARLRG
ncbi:MAG TPA: glycosyl hydrolase family 28 protein [Tepidisphaeraceae bacterium]|jgi:hypothetical protein